MAWIEIEDSKRSPREERGITLKSKTLYINAGLQKEIGSRRFRVLVDDEDFKLAIKFEQDGNRTCKTPDVIIAKTYSYHPWLKKFIGKFVAPEIINKEMIIFKLPDGEINIQKIEPIQETILDKDKDYRVEEIAVIFGCSRSHIKRKLNKIQLITPTYKAGKNKNPVCCYNGNEINIALELQPDLFKKQITTLNKQN